MPILPPRSLPLVLVVCALVVGCKSREEQLQDAEDKGNLLAAKKARLVEGVGKALQGEGKDAAEAVTKGGGEVLKAAGKGFDQSLAQVKLSVHEALPPKGIGGTRAAIHREKEKRAVTVYVTLDQPYTGALELRAFDAENQEIGRSKVQVDEAESTAKYLDFAFDERTPLLTADRFELR
jgi:hypothetical protein